jgi:divalent metal cation (Fe/Co/Zn/Cd) transporter
MNRVVMLASGSILVGFVVLALKSLAYFMTGSVALLSDAIESIVNVVTAIAALSPAISLPCCAIQTLPMQLPKIAG